MYDLRGIVVSSYEKVLDVFFEDADSEAMKEMEKELSIGLPNIATFKVKSKVLEEIRNGKTDAFRYMERKMLSREKSGIIVFDELQKLKDIYLIGGSRKPLIKELFNFFVRLTKVLHLSHVIVMTSDTFFIEQVYIDSTLKNTSEFYLVDFFDDDTAREILISEGLSEKDASYVVDWIGGVPWMMERVLSNGDIKDSICRLYLQTRSRLVESMRNRNDLKEILKRVLSGENLYYEDRVIDKVKELVDKEILFMDPINGIVKFHTKLDERAAKELLKK